MAKKSQIPQPSCNSFLGDRVNVKFVKKANMWCKTTITHNNKGELQNREWFLTQQETIGGET